MENVSGGLQPGPAAGEAASIDQAVSTAWARARAGLRNEFGEEAFRSWINPLTLEAVRGTTAILSIKSRFLRDWVSTNYAPRIVSHFNAEHPGIVTVDLVVNASAAADEALPEAPQPAAVPEEEADTPVSAPLDPRYTFDSFVVGKPNELAYAAAQRVAESESIQFNPLFIHGGVGLGKTHLMHAIAWRIRERTPWRRVAYI